MRKKVFKYTIRIVLGLICFGTLLSCVNNSNDPAEILKRRIDKAEMVEYIDTVRNARLLYPDFFKIDSVGKYYASFSYSDKDVKELNLYYIIYPPRWIESSKEYVRINTDSLTTFSKVKLGSFIMTQEYEYFPQLKSVSKYSETIHGWTSYTLTYEKQYEDAVGRLTRMVDDWKIYDEDNPKWFTDICDFLDI